MEIHFDENGTPYVDWGGNTIRLEKEPITEKVLIEKAEKELRETPEIREQALRELRELLKAEKSLIIPSEKDDFLLKFLRPCKFYATSGLKRIQAYYKFRRSHSDYCRDLMPSTIRSAFNHNIVSILAPRDQHGRRIMFVESGALWNPRDVPLSEVFRGVQLGLESAMVEPRTQVCGVITIIDMKGLSFSQVLQFTPSFAKMVVDWIQSQYKEHCVLYGYEVASSYKTPEAVVYAFIYRVSYAPRLNNHQTDCIPIRLKAVHIVNQPYIFNMLFAVFKPFLREKLRSRIFFHGNSPNLLNHVDAIALRKRHGGLLPEPEISGDVLWKMLYHYEEDFKLANSYGFADNNNK